MNDKQTTMQELKDIVATFVDERDWGQFHDPKNLSMAIAIEAAELMEIFQWTTSHDAKTQLETQKQDIANELADITAYILSFCTRYHIDLSIAIENKMKHNRQKYPIDQVKGSTEKYYKIKRSKQ